jgi:hypothetical protein
MKKFNQLDITILIVSILFTVSSFGLLIQEQRFCFLICAFIGVMMIGKIFQLKQNKNYGNNKR